MGGTWSGERSWKKPTVEECLAIDAVDLRRWNILAPSGGERSGAFTWGRNGEGKPESTVSYILSIGPRSGALRLQYSLKEAGERFDYSVRLVTTTCHLGGVRWWLTCPLVRESVACARRVRKLYLRGRYFGCRHCHGLAYRSSQESDSRVYALLRSSLDRLGDPRSMSLPQLGLALKALKLREKRLDRITRRPSRSRSQRQANGDTNKC